MKAKLVLAVLAALLLSPALSRATVAIYTGTYSYESNSTSIAPYKETGHVLYAIDTTTYSTASIYWTTIDGDKVYYPYDALLYHGILVRKGKGRSYFLTYSRIVEDSETGEFEHDFLQLSGVKAKITVLNSPLTKVDLAKTLTSTSISHYLDGGSSSRESTKANLTFHPARSNTANNPSSPKTPDEVITAQIATLSAQGYSNGF